MGLCYSFVQERTVNQPKTFKYTGLTRCLQDKFWPHCPFVKRRSTGGVSSTAFGTAFHSYVESQINGLRKPPTHPGVVALAEKLWFDIRSMGCVPVMSEVISWSRKARVATKVDLICVNPQKKGCYVCVEIKTGYTDNAFIPDSRQETMHVMDHVTTSDNNKHLLQAHFASLLFLNSYRSVGVKRVQPWVVYVNDRKLKGCLDRPDLNFSWFRPEAELSLELLVR